MHWYYFFLAAVFLLWLGATDADRSALRIVLIATVASWLIVDLITVRFTGAWKLAVPATVETATALALLKWARNKTGYFQAGCVVFAWVAHVVCFADIQLGTDVIYSRYDTMLGVVALAQVALFHDTITQYFLQLGHWWANHRPAAFPASGIASPVPHHPRPEGVQPVAPCPTIYAKK